MQKAGQPQVLKWYNSSLIQQLILENLTGFQTGSSPAHKIKSSDSK